MTVTAPPQIPEGFHVYAVPALDRDRIQVYRNWQRTTRASARPHILIMEDNVQLLDILGQLFDDEGYDTTLSWRPLRSEDIRRLRPDAIFADVSYFLDDDEISLLDTTMTDGHAPAPIIYSTSTPEVARILAQRGHVALVKPFDLDELMELITSATC